MASQPPAEGQGQSKNARRRANKRAAAEAEASPAPAPPPAADPPAAKAKAKAKAKAEPAPAPAPVSAKAQAEPKAKAKAKAQPEPPVVEEAPKAKAKAKAAAGKAAPKQQAGKAVNTVVEKQPPEEKPELVNWTVDDGLGGEWESVSGMSKKQQKRKENQERAKESGGLAQSMPANQKAIPGMGAGDGSSRTADLKGVSQAAQAEVDRILNAKGEEVSAAPKEKLATATVHVKESMVGIVIGPKGARIKLIQEKTGVTSIDTKLDPWVIVGEPAKVAEAKQALEELADKGYCAMLYDNFSENMVNVHPSVFPDLIGKGGVVIRKIKDELGVEVKIPPVPSDAPSSKKFKVVLAGNSENVEKAKTCINDIVMYSHSELTHPGVVHAELEVEPWAYRYIIGSKGSEMRHISKNWHVKVAIPREHSANQHVVVSGEPKDVEGAKTYIEKLLWKAENQASSGRDKVEAIDEWGDEVEEDWMKAYMYKR